MIRHGGDDVELQKENRPESNHAVRTIEIINEKSFRFY
jgi:hypothetical protein